MPILSGQPPDLTFFYDRLWFTEGYTTVSNDQFEIIDDTVPVVADPTQPKENRIGFIQRHIYFVYESFQQMWTLFFPQGSITFFPCASVLEATDDRYGFIDNETLIFRIASGTKDFFACNGYVCFVTDSEGGRTGLVYLDK